MGQSESRKQRSERQTLEVERSQGELRASIARTKQLLDESDTMLKRHRDETEDDGRKPR